MGYKRRLTTLLTVVCTGAGMMAHAASPVTFSGSQLGNSLSATVTFADLGGGDLQVTLANTYTGDTVDQSHVLTGVFFAGTGTLTPLSATAGAGSVEWIGSTSSA